MGIEAKSYRLSLPALIGSIHHQTPLQLAEKVIGAADERSMGGSRRWQPKGNRQFGVMVDAEGHVMLLPSGA